MDSNYYENPDHWDTERYHNDYERNRLAHAAALIPSDVRSLADVGCGNGLFLKFLEDFRPELLKTGFERSVAAISSRRCVSQVVRSSADNLPLKHQAVDIVSCLAVIEHLTHDIYKKALSEIERISKKYILINVPHGEKRVFVKCPACSCRFNPSFHLRSYHSNSYSRLFKEFCPIDIKYKKGPEPLVSWVVRRLPVHLSATRYADAVCPQCNWRPIRPMPVDNTGARASGFKKVLRHLPPILEVREAFVLYQRMENI
jgi:ubiquinone/menaquinone biosynthesis C-methylase UbiE